jgi:hypothetical protein
MLDNQHRNTPRFLGVMDLLPGIPQGMDGYCSTSARTASNLPGYPLQLTFLHQAVLLTTMAHLTLTSLLLGPRLVATVHSVVPSTRRWGPLASHRPTLATLHHMLYQECRQKIEGDGQVMLAPRIPLSKGDRHSCTTKNALEWDLWVRRVV